MRTPRHYRAARFSRRAYERLLVAYPARFRGLYGEEMADLFEDGCRERLAREGARGLLLFWVRALLDLSGNAVAERAAERGGSLTMRSSSGLVRWGGVSAAVGGLLTLSYGVVVTAVGMNRLARPGDFGVGLAPATPDALMLLGGLGSVLFFGGLVALVRLIERGGQHPAPVAGRGVLALSGRLWRLSWAQRSAVAGVVLGAVAAAACVVLLAKVLVSEPAFVAGPAAGAPAALFAALGTAKILGLPLATALLGVAAWRSGVLGRWGALPVALGLGMSPLGIAVVLLLFHVTMDMGGILGSDLARDLILFGIPNAANGLGWAMLGWLLYSGRSEDGRGIALAG